MFTALLSSHCSSPVKMPSPYLGRHMSGEVLVPPEQVHVGRTDMQSAEQPYPSVELKSSQISGSHLMLFPQTSQRLGLTFKTQFVLDSMTHPELQPSPLIKLESSHCSDVDLSPSPHENEQIEGSAKVQVNPNSIVQEEEQPSKLLRFPSSHYSEIDSLLLEQKD